MVSAKERRPGFEHWSNRGATVVILYLDRKFSVPLSSTSFSICKVRSTVVSVCFDEAHVRQPSVALL